MGDFTRSKTFSDTPGDVNNTVDSAALHALLDTATITVGAVVTDRLGAGAVSAAKLATDAVETAKIKDANVTAAKLASDAVETAKIKDGAVTLTKLADDARPVNYDFGGAKPLSDGSAGLVPAPKASDRDKVLKGDGSWGDVQAEADAAVAASPYIKFHNSLQLT